MAKQMFKFLKMKNNQIKSAQSMNTNWYVGSKNVLAGYQQPSLCNSGFHASPSPVLAALSCSGNVLALVAGSGKEVHDAEKSAFSEMEIVQYWYLDDRFLFDVFTAYAATERATLPITIKDNVMTNYGPLILKGKAPLQRVKDVMAKLSYPDKFDIISDIALWANTNGRNDIILTLERTFMAHIGSTKPNWSKLR